MTAERSDALVFFGATGDLAHKKIFPALQAMVKRGNLNVPVIGVAKAGWDLDHLKARARDSVENHGGLDPVKEAATNIMMADRLRAIAATLVDHPALTAAIARQDATESLRIVADALYRNPT